MAISTNARVLGDFADMGYTLEQDDGDETVSVYYKGSFVDRFLQRKVTEKLIRKACQEHWDGLISLEAY